MNKARLKLSVLLKIIICIISISFVAKAFAIGYSESQYKNLKNKIEFVERSSSNVLDSDAFEGITLAPGLRVEDHPISTAKNDQGAPVVAYNDKGNEYLVVWWDERNKNTSGKDIYAKFVSSAGELKGSEIAINLSSGDQWGMDIAYNSIDGEYLIIWNDDPGGNIQGQRISSAGVLVGTKLNITNSVKADTTALAYNSKDGKYLVVWDEGDIYQNLANIFGQMLSKDGTPQSGKFAVCSESYNQYNPTIAYNSGDNEFLVVWQDERNTVGDLKHIDIYGKRVTGLGQPNVSDISISPISNDEYKQLPIVAYNSVRGGDLVVWAQGKTLSSRNIYGRLVTSGGAMESNPIILCSANGKQSNPVVAYSKTDKEYLIVWDDARGANEDIYGQKLSETGQLNGTNFAISTALEDQDLPAIVYNNADSNYLVTWSDDRNNSVSAGDIYAQIIGDIVVQCPKGDVDGNGVVNSKDALLVLQFIVNLKTPTDLQKCSADVTGDGEIKVNDVIKILQIAVGSASPAKDYISTDRFAISIDEVQNIAGKSVLVPIMADDISRLAGGEMSIAFDSSILKVSDVSSDNLLVWNLVKSGNLRIAFANSAKLSNKTLAMIRFDVIANDASPIKFGKVNLYDLNGKLLKPKVIDGKFRSYDMPAEQNVLLQNFPNPFNPETWIPYQLKDNSEVTIKIFDANGGLVRELALGNKLAGIYTSSDRSAYWDGKDKFGMPVASGVYFYTIKTNDFSAVRKLTILK